MPLYIPRSPYTAQNLHGLADFPNEPFDDWLCDASGIAGGFCRRCQSQYLGQQDVCASVPLLHQAELA